MLCVSLLDIYYLALYISNTYLIIMYKIRYHIFNIYLTHIYNNI